MQILKRLLTLIMQVSSCSFMAASFFRFMTSEEFLTVWHVSFAVLSLAYASLTLINLFAIIAESLKHLTELNASVTNYERRDQGVKRPSCQSKRANKRD